MNRMESEKNKEISPSPVEDDSIDISNLTEKQKQSLAKRGKLSNHSKPVTLNGTSPLDGVQCKPISYHIEGICMPK